ncbi:MAG: protein kinase [Nannocystaceae bacterium]
MTIFARPPASPSDPDVDPWGGGGRRRDERGAGDHGSDGAASLDPSAAAASEVRASASPDLSGTVLHDRYELVRRIGAGGMGEVYEGCFLASGQRVAVKLLSERLTHSEEMLARFRHELRALEAIRHPAIVTARDFCTTGWRPYLVMEFVEGEDLSRRRKRPMGEVSRIGIQVCSALEAMHSRGILHRDLKPHNILARGEGRGVEVTIVDFGVSKLTALYYAQGRPYQTPPGQRVHTRKGFAFGTPGYMAPEVYAAEEPSPRQDVFSLGVVLYELLVGAKPPQGWLVEIPDDVDHEALGLDALTWRVILKAIEPDPVVRYQSAADFREALEDLLLNVDDDVAASDAPVSRAGASAAGRSRPEASAAEGGASNSAGAWPRVAEGATASPPRRSLGWTVAAILALYMVVDRVVYHEGAPGVPSTATAEPAAVMRTPEVSAASTIPSDTAEVEAGPSTITPRASAGDGPAPSVAEEASRSAAHATPPDVAVTSTSPTTETDIAATSTSPIETNVAASLTSPTIESDVAGESPPRSRPRPLTASAFRKAVQPKRAALDRCARGLRGGPAVDAIVAVSGSGAVEGVRLSPAGVSRFAVTCASEVFGGLHFARTGADSTHIWPLYRPEGQEE